MNELSAKASGSWQDWLMVVGYVSFMLFIVWRVILSGNQE